MATATKSTKSNPTPITILSDLSDFEDTHQMRSTNQDTHRNGESAELLALLLLSATGVFAEPVALVADRIIDGRADRALAYTTIVVDSARIEAIGDRRVIPAGAEVIELPGTTLMPGMIDAHEHPLMYADDYQNAHLQGSSAYKALMGLAALQRQLMAGWTSVRVMG